MIELLAAAFGSWPYDIGTVEPAEFFRWKHAANPFGRSLMLVAEADGEPIGFGAWLRWRLLAGERRLEAMRGVDFVVDPRHRGRGVPELMIGEATKRFPEQAVVSFSNPNERARPGAVRSGRHDVGVLRRYIGVGRPLGALARSVRGRAPGQVRAETAATVLGDGDAIASLLAEAQRDPQRLVTDRSLEYLRWRYGRFDTYRAVRVDDGTELSGLAVFRTGRLGPAAKARICELIVRRDRPGAVRRVLRAVRRAAPVELLACGFPTGLAAARHGFLPAPGGLRLVARPLAADLSPDPRRLDSWGLSIGDRELI